MAVVNLEAYLSGIDLPSTGGLLLCTRHADLALGLFLPAIGPTIRLDEEQSTDVLDIDALLTDVVRQIGMAAAMPPFRPTGTSLSTLFPSHVVWK